MVTERDTVVNDCTSSVVELTTPTGARMFEFLDAGDRAKRLAPFVRALAVDACHPSTQRAREVVERAAALALAARSAELDITDLLSRMSRLVFVTERQLGDLRPDIQQNHEWRAHWMMLDEMSSRACIYAFSREAFGSDAAWHRALDTIASNPAGAADAVRRAAQAHDADGAAVIATDISGTILFWNENATTLYGWRQPEVVGQNIMHVTPSTQSMGEAEQIMRQLAAGQTWSGTIVLRDKRGASMRTVVTDTPVVYNGVIVGIVGISKKAGEDGD
jgi:PAS domain S-box-containing protein